jgi:hypothetical protein
VGLDLLRQQARAREPPDPRGDLPELGGRAAEGLDLDHVGQLDQRVERGVVDEVVEGDRVTGALQAPRGPQYLLVGLDVLQDLEHHLVGRQRQRVPLQQEAAGDVDPRRCAPTRRGSPISVNAVRITSEVAASASTTSARLSSPLRKSSSYPSTWPRASKSGCRATHTDDGAGGGGAMWARSPISPRGEG